ncbi:MAG TPA: hypothetical protein VFZ27_00880 [Terriglobia bacterium]|nr:hypothetical protein [Terriglobia bacterium]
MELVSLNRFQFIGNGQSAEVDDKIVRQKNTFFKKQTGEVIENKGSGGKTNRNKPKNKAEKLLKTP